MKVYMEHANITVNDVSNAVHFFQTAFPEFHIRGAGEGPSGNWVHVGTDNTYIALTEGRRENTDKDYGRLGFNHVGFVVEDVQAVAERLSLAGFKRSYQIQRQTFRIRDYFLDGDGNEYEFVQYLSDKAEERNDYNG